MEYPDLRAALVEYFGVDSQIESPEDYSEAWRSIVRECKDGQYPGLVRELDRFLKLTDEEIFEFLQSCAPAWGCDSPADARRGMEVFQSYLDAYSD